MAIRIWICRRCFAALGARVSVTGQRGTREIAVEDLYAGYYETTLEKNELIAEAIVPPLNGAKAAYMKVTSRSADDWPALNIGVRLETDGPGRIREARIVISAATEKVTRLKDTEKLLTGAVGQRRAAQAGRRCRHRRGLVPLRCAWLCRLQERIAARLSGPRRSGGAVVNQIGRSIPRLEARAKVTGRAEYVHNMRVPGMLYGKIFRSTVAHGRILSIDTSAARETEGVYAVVTGEDIRSVIPNPYFGPAFHDQPILALEKVHFVGEPVAVVLSHDPHIADAAVQTIAAEYEELPPVFDEVEAMTSDAIVHEVLKPAGTFADLKHLAGRKHTNVTLDYQLRRGDVEAGFAAADHIFEHTFRTGQVLHVPLESHASLAEPGHDSLIIHTSSQTPSFVRMEIARLLGWPENRVSVRVPFLGGGFGAKVYVKMEALAAALALIARRPVKIALTMEEQFYTIGKHATTFRIKSGVTKDGRIIARACDVWWNGGAYADIGPRVAQKSGFTAAGPYDIEHVRIDSAEVYTNRPPAGALRGFGVPQLVWAYESHTDLIARALGIDADRIPPQEHPARRPSAGDRHDHEGCGHRQGARPPRRADELERAVRPRNGADQARTRYRHRLQGVDFADHVGRHRQCQRRWQHRALHQHHRHGAGLRHRHGADRRGGAQRRRRKREGGARQHRRRAL